MVVVGLLLCGVAAADPEVDFTSAAPNDKLVVCAAAEAVIAKRSIEAIAAGVSFSSGTEAYINTVRYQLLSQVQLDLARKRGQPSAVLQAYERKLAAYSEQAPLFKDVFPLRQMAVKYCGPLFEQHLKEGSILQEDLEALEARARPELEAQIREATLRGERARAGAESSGR